MRRVSHADGGPHRPGRRVRAAGDRCDAAGRTRPRRRWRATACPAPSATRSSRTASAPRPPPTAASACSRGGAERPIFGPHAIEPGLAPRHALVVALPAGRRPTRPVGGVVRVLPHADDARARRRRHRGRVAARADAVRGVAAQRLRGGAGRRRATRGPARTATCRRSPSRRRSPASSASRGRTCRGTPSSAPTPSCCGCSIATVTRSASRRPRRHSPRPRAAPSAS